MKHSLYLKFLFCFFIISIFFTGITYAEPLFVVYATNERTYSECVDYQSQDPHSNIMYDFIIPLSIEFIGAFLGFFFAIQLGNITKQQQLKNVNIELFSELRVIANDIKSTYQLRENTNGEITGGHVDIVFLYQTPKWDILLSAGELATIVNKSKKTNIDFLDIYSDIFHAQSLENEYLTAKRNANSNDSFFETYITKIKEEKLKIAIQIYTKISQLHKEK